MQQPASIFNDVIGPIMVGPSSSHTAASVRIGYLIRNLTRNKPEKVVFEYSRKGSLVDYHEIQGSDMGLAAGILGFAMDDPRIADSLNLAKEAGIDISFIITEDAVDHPNTYKFTAHGGGRVETGEIISTGGGMIEIRKISDIPVVMSGGYHETVLLLGVIEEAEALEVADNLTHVLVSYDEITVHSNKNGKFLVNIKSEQTIDLESVASIQEWDIIQFAPVLPVKSLREYSGLFNTAKEIQEIAQKENLALWQVAVKYEMRRGNMSEAEVLANMEHLVKVIKRTLHKVSVDQKNYDDRILGPQAHLLDQVKLLPNQTMNLAIKYITLLMEAKSSLEVIVAAPTAGSCGALPGTIIGVADSMGLGDEEIVKAMLASALIGILIAEHSTFAAEVCGCQAECGSASGMAAAGLVQIMGGTVDQALTAASMALQNVCGMVCDPVADRVEVPCLGKNIMAGSNAIAMANLALAGFDGVIPLDETIDALYKTGLTIDSTLRCTGKAGLSVTPTSQALWQKLNS